MLITFSGIVGSGKSTNAKYVRDLIEGLSDQPVYLRFRFLSWRKMFADGSKKKKKSSNVNNEVNAETLRKNQIAPLKFVHFAGYLGRMLNFRLFKLLRLQNHIAICDRYFYDNLVHYHLKSRRERVYFEILKKAIPKPDVGFMLMTEPQTILQRREQYEPKYIYTLSENYKKVAGAFTNLTVVKTDDTTQVADILAFHIRERMNANQKGIKCHSA